MVKEYSAGGIVLKGQSILLVLTNRKGEDGVWTFPKGHIEEGETPKDAALREVFEETGVRCRIIDEKEFFINSYTFKKQKNEIFKTVYWYLMEPVDETGKIENPKEIKETRWVSADEAIKMLNYESDKKMVNILKERFFKKDSGGK